MKRKKSKPVPALQAHACFPLRAVCGTWESLCGSPCIRIYHDGIRYRLQFIYKHDAVFTVPLRQSWGITFFYFYGMIRIAYDEERELLSLDIYGSYKRESL
ncbi:MAG: DUF3876 domain-containing protein [Tannerellaceae bacterium]|jgi:hypothetical protein|nr:DUF3876 domain-containing protein [Tannerellaceae bacterium]